MHKESNLKRQVKVIGISFALMICLVCGAFWGLACLDIYLHMQQVRSTVECNGVTYRITAGHPLFDEQLTHIQLVRDKYGFDTRFLGYSGGYEIVCDEKNAVANVIRTTSLPPGITGVLVHSDGQKPQAFVEYTGARLEDHLCFLSRSCREGEERGDPLPCLYTLYRCDLDFTSCVPLPIEFTDKFNSDYEMEADNASGTLKLYDEYDADSRTLIFVYGKDPHCYVENCSIKKEK